MYPFPIVQQSYSVYLLFLQLVNLSQNVPLHRLNSTFRTLTTATYTTIRRTTLATLQPAHHRRQAKTALIAHQAHPTFHT